MDSFTQIVLGAAVGNAIAGKTLKNRAIVYGAIAGTIPDLDVVFGFLLDPLSAVEIHRGLTHSILFAFLSSFVFGAIVYFLEKKRHLSYEAAYMIFFWGLFTHSLLDIFTTWGTRLLWPLDYAFAFKSIFVIDPLYTLPFLVCLVLSMLQRTDMRKRMFYNNLGLGISTTYLLLTLWLKALAFYSFTDALDSNNIVYTSISVKPSALNTILWNCIVETPDEFLIGDYSFFDTSEIQWKAYPKNHHLIGDIAQSDLFLRLKDLSENCYTVSVKNDVVYFNDLRFGVLAEDKDHVQFAFSYEFYCDQDGVLGVREAPKQRSDGFALLKKLWVRLQGV